ncbi:MAG TPA: dTMP kinase [Gemmatimonadales bacterium]|nr:dTMP kinase [Gemmatimonadales bacterium]
MTHGFFLAVEGPEGAGKSTLVSGLAARLRQEGAEPLVVREPGGTEAAEAIRRILLAPESHLAPGSELYLFLAARADLVAKRIRPALEAGSVVIADRFELSTLAYQVGGRGLDESLVRTANQGATGGLSPDLTLILDVPPRTGLSRIQKAGGAFDRIEREDDGFHLRVAETFSRASGKGFIHLDGAQSPEQVLHRAWDELLQARAAAKPQSN